MKDITKILVPFDLSSNTENALQYAISFADNDKSIEVLLMHISEVSDDNSYKKKLENKLEQIKNKHPNFKGVINWVLKSGDLIENISNTQKELMVDLIIMGTKGSEKETAVTNTSKLVLETDCPVIVIPKGVKEFKLKKIALVLGKNEIDDATVLEVLLDIARRFHAKVHVLTICNKNTTYGYSKIDEKNENILEYYLKISILIILFRKTLI